jgi:O-antigen/teichoic acid export membrane protein
VRQLAKEGIVVGAGQALGVAARFATVWWLTRVLAPDAFCELALIQGVATLGFGILCGALLQAGLRFQSEAMNDRTTGALRALLKPLVVRAAWFTVAALIAIAVAWKSVTGSAVSMTAIAVGIALIVPDAYRYYDLGVLNAARRQSTYAIWTAADAIARPIGAVAAMSVLGRTPQAALGGFVAAAVAVNVVCARVFDVHKDEDRTTAPSPEIRSRIVRFAAPLVPFALMAWIVGLADRYVLAEIAGKSVAGQYAAVYGLGSQAFLAVGIFGLTVFRPLYFAAVDAGDARRGRRVLGAWLATLAGASLAGIAALFFFGRPIARICLGPEFQAGAPLLPWIGAAYGLQSLQTMFEVVLYARHRTARLLQVQIAGAVTALVLYAVLIPRYGGLGAALATIGSFAVSCIVAAKLSDVFGAIRPGHQGAAAR